MKITYTVILSTDAEGGYTVIVPTLPGCVTEGETIGEALRRAEEAIACHVESLAQRGQPIPPDGPTLSFDNEGLIEAFVFRVTAYPEVEAVTHA